MQKSRFATKTKPVQTNPFPKNIRFTLLTISSKLSLRSSLLLCLYSKSLYLSPNLTKVGYGIKIPGRFCRWSRKRQRRGI